MSISDEPQRIKSDLLLVIAIVVVSAVLRLAFVSNASIEHFDEGVYASNMWFGAESNFQYPKRHLYAPSLLPMCIEWSIVLFGGGAIGGILISLVVGCLTVALLWLVAARFFGRVAAFAVALLACMSDFHVLYSRTALTEVMLCFWLVLSVWLIFEAIRNDSYVLSVLAGVATGLSWWTKYNGWLPIAIGFSGTIGWLLFRRRASLVAWFRPIMLCLLIGVVACAVWYPFLYSLGAEHGGYTSVANNHSRFVVGLAGWLPSFMRHVENHRHFDSWISISCIGLVWVGAAIMGVSRFKRFTWNGSSLAVVNSDTEKIQDDKSQPNDLRQSPLTLVLAFAAIGCVLSALASVVGSSVVIGALAIWGLIIPLCSLTSDAEENNRRLVYWLVLAWFVGLILATPMYRPFPRLSLPWLMAAWLGAATAIDRLLGMAIERPSTMWSKTIGYLQSYSYVSIVLILASVVSIPFLISKPTVQAWQSRTGLELVADQIARDTKLLVTRSSPANSESPYIVYVYAEPALLFHLSQIDASSSEYTFITHPVSDLGFASPKSATLLPIYLARTDPGDQQANIAEALKPYGSEFELVGEYEYEPSDLILLNEPNPALTSDRPPDIVRLYRLRRSFPGN